MTKGEILKLDRAIGLFNFTGAKVELVMKAIKIKSAVSAAREEISKQLNDIFTALKPENLESLQEEQKQLFSENEPDKEKINIIQVRIRLLLNEQQTKYQEAEKAILAESYKIDLVKINREELDILRKEKREPIDLEQGRRDVVVTNNFSIEDFSALSPIIE